MTPSPQATSALSTRRVLALAVTLLAALCALLALGQSSAPAQDSAAELDSKMNELEQNVDRQGTLQEQIDSQNAAINDLIARESELRRKADAVQAELDQRQAELEEATALVEDERAHLRAVRERLHRALDSLEKLLVDIYKSDSPDTLAVILNSASFDELVAQSEYLERIQDYDDAMVERVRGLREEAEAALASLREAQDTIRESRNAIAERRRELAAAEQGIAAEHADLVALRSERQANLDALQAREKTLEDELGTSIPGPGERATLLPNGEAVAPSNAPLVVKAAIDAANNINDKPYIWGGGHGSFEDDGYDCSGAVSYAMHGGGLLDSPIDSGGFTAWGSPGGGNWITVYANYGHVYAVIAGLRWDTSMTGGNGPRWSTEMRSPSGFVARHPDGF
jgi:peptidoglycan hydrolase CwlO-like protein